METLRRTIRERDEEIQRFQSDYNQVNSNRRAVIGRVDVLCSFLVNVRKDCAEDAVKIANYEENIHNLQDSFARLDIVEVHNSSL